MQEDQCRDDAEKAASYDKLLNLLKEKVDKASTSSEKIKLLTIAPDYWSIRAVQDFFNVAEYALQIARAKTPPPFQKQPPPFCITPSFLKIPELPPLPPLSRKNFSSDLKF